MKEYIEERAVELAYYILENYCTSSSEKFGISKSTVHKDITERLERINSELAKKVRRILNENKAERHIREGRRQDFAMHLIRSGYKNKSL